MLEGANERPDNRPDSRRVVTRRQLYEMVWERPVSHVAKDFGISHVELGRICRRTDVPAPSRVDWAKRRAGKRVKKPPLPRPEFADEPAIGGRPTYDHYGQRVYPWQTSWQWLDALAKDLGAYKPPPAPPEVDDPGEPPDRRRPRKVRPPRFDASARRAATDEEIEPLFALCRAGRLFEVQEWIATGRPVNPPLPAKGRQFYSPFRATVRRGFHSLVRVLLEGGAAIEPTDFGSPV